MRIWDIPFIITEVGETCSPSSLGLLVNYPEVIVRRATWSS